MFAFLYALASTPIVWSNPASVSATSAATVSASFSTPTGGSGSFTYSAVLSKPGGSGASLSGTFPNYSFTSDVSGSYSVTVTATDSRGQKSYSTYSYSLALTTWTVVEDYDFTTATPVANLPTGSSTSVTVGGDTISVTVTNVVNTATPSVSCSVSSTGLNFSVGRASGTGGAVSVVAIPLPMSFNTKKCCVEVVFAPTAMPTNSDAIIFDGVNPATLPASGSNAKALWYNRISSSSYTCQSGTRSSGNTTKSSGSQLSTSLSASLHAQFIGFEDSVDIRVDESTTVSTPGTPSSYSGHCGAYSTLAPADSARSAYGSGQLYLLLAFSANSSTPVTGSIKRVRVLESA